MSYFNEYFSTKKQKSMREYSRPFSLLRYPDEWVINRAYAWKIVYDLDDSPHFPAIPKSLVKTLRPVDALEYSSSEPVEWPKPKKGRS